MTEDASIKDICYFESNSLQFGKSFGEWTVKWWRWALETAKSINPVTDETGKFADINQPKDVWFLAGKFVDGTRNLPKRHCRIPVEKGILFPIINCEANRLEYPELDAENDLITHVEKDIDSILVKECFINGKSLPPQRQKSDPRIFEININEDNGLGVKGGKTIATSDGYWIFLKPLPEGQYDIEFEGMCGIGTRYSGASYSLTIE
ncbi:MAG TPA: hypothetical protein VH415_02810 [Nitrososphaeraceae archaeon]